MRQGAGKTFVVEIVESWTALEGMLQIASLTAVVVVDPYRKQKVSEGLAPELRSLIRAFPATTVIAAVDPDSRLADVRTLGAWGAAEVIPVEQYDAAAIRQLLLLVRGRPLQSVLERALPESAGGQTRAALSAAAEIAAAGGQAEDLARSLFVSIRTLHRRFEAAALPPPRQTLAWMRILLAAELLEQPGRGIEDVATSCGYASDSGLRRAFSDLLGMSPTALRARGGFATAAERFREALAVGRKTPPERKAHTGV